MKQSNWLGFVLVVVIIALLSYLAFDGGNAIGIPGIKDTRLGIDIKGGIYTTLYPDLPEGEKPGEEDLNSARRIIETRLESKGIFDKNITVITRLSNENPDVEIVAGFDINDSIKNPYPVFNNPCNCNVDADVIVDFSNPEVLDDLLEFAVTKKISLVLATTGLSDLQKNKIKEYSNLYNYQQF